MPLCFGEYKRERVVNVIVAVSADGSGKRGRTYVRRQKDILGLFLYFPLRFATSTDGELVIAGGGGGWKASYITSRSNIFHSPEICERIFHIIEELSAR